eukprot:282649-Rhodomonas_salina.2
MPPTQYSPTIPGLRSYAQAQDGPTGHSQFATYHGRRKRTHSASRLARTVRLLTWGLRSQFIASNASVIAFLTGPLVLTRAV